MTMWTPNLEHRTGPRYLAIADSIAEAVSSGALAPGDRLPPQRRLAWRLGVTTGTVGRAYMLAHQNGLVSGTVGRGTYVLEAARFEGSNQARQPELVPHRASNVLDLTRNAPATAAQDRAIKTALENILARPGLGRLLEYMPTEGHPDHRAAGVTWVKRVGLEATIDQVMICGGSQQALAVCMATLLRPGDTVLCEDFTYSGVLDAANMFGVNPYGVTQDEDGLVPEALETACRETGARVLFVLPTLQNPTTCTMSEQRRREIVEIARRYDLIMVEDDVYGYLPEHRPLPVISLAPERTLYVASASKCLAPGLRVAWLIAPKHLIPRLADSLHGLAVSQPALNAEIVRLWIEDGTADKMIEWQRQETAARQAIAAEQLDGLEFRGHSAGFHVLLHLPPPWRAEAFATTALERGVRVVPASVFSANRDNAPPAVRISLSPNGNRETLARALATIADLARTTPRVGRAIV